MSYEDGNMTSLTRKPSFPCFTSVSALNKGMFPNGHAMGVPLQLCSGSQAGCSGHWAKPCRVLRTHPPQSFPIPCLEMHPKMPDDQNECFPITWHEWTLKILVMGEALFHNKISAYSILSPHCPAPKQTHCLSKHMSM